jgi:hypothetical protein
MRNISRLLAVLVATLVSQSASAIQGTPAVVVQPPETPAGLPVCEQPFVLDAPSPYRLGERFEYSVEVVGLSLGLVHIETARQGMFEGQKVTEVRGWIDPDPAVSALVTLEGRASALLPETGSTPVKSMVRYRFHGDVVAESQIHRAGGLDVRTDFEKNGERVTAERQFPSPVHDFLSSFLMLRGLPKDARGCAVIVANDKAYTVWLEPQGSEALETGRGTASFDRYLLRYGSDRTHTVRDVLLWISSGPERIPYQAKGLNSYSPTVRLAGYRPGRS